MVVEGRTAEMAITIAMSLVRSFTVKESQLTTLIIARTIEFKVDSKVLVAPTRFAKLQVPLSCPHPSIAICYSSGHST